MVVQLVTGAVRTFSAGKEVASATENARNAVQQAKKYRRATQASGSNIETKKLGGVFYWMVLVLAILKDTLDVFANFVFMTASGLAGASFFTFIGPLVAMGIAGAVWLICTLVGLLIIVAIGIYFSQNKSALVSGAVIKHFAVMGATVIIEMFPGLSFVPMTTISFLVRAKLTNMERAHLARKLKKSTS